MVYKIQKLFLVNRKQTHIVLEFGWKGFRTCTVSTKAVKIKYYKTRGEYEQVWILCAIERHTRLERSC